MAAKNRRKNLLAKAMTQANWQLLQQRHLSLVEYTPTPLVVDLDSIHDAFAGFHGNRILIKIKKGAVQSPA